MDKSTSLASITLETASNPIDIRQMHTKTLYLLLGSPAAIRLDDTSWPTEKRCKIDHREVYSEDTPWWALVGDLLIDGATRELAGMTFQLDRWNWEQAKRLAERCDPKVVRYDDDEAGKVPILQETHRFEIRWGTAPDLQCEVAQLLWTQWVWWYKYPGEGPDWNRVMGFGITDIDHILRDHKLTFPDVSHLPPLTVEWF